MTRWISGVAGLGFSYNELSQSLLKFNRNVFTSLRIGSVYGESLGSIEKAMNRVRSTTTLSQQDFAEMAASIKNVYIGIPPTTEEIGKMASEMQKRFGYSSEATQKLMGDLSAMQQRMPDMWDAIREAQDAYGRSMGEGGAKATILMARMQALGFSASEVRDAMSSIRPPTFESGGVLDFEKKLSKNKQTIEDSQLKLSQNLKPALEAMSSTMAQLAKTVGNLNSTIQNLAATMLVLEGVGVRVFGAKMAGWIDNATGLSAGLGGVSKVARSGARPPPIPPLISPPMPFSVRGDSGKSVTDFSKPLFARQQSANIARDIAKDIEAPMERAGIKSLKTAKVGAFGGLGMGGVAMGGMAVAQGAIIGASIGTAIDQSWGTFITPMINELTGAQLQTGKTLHEVIAKSTTAMTTLMTVLGGPLAGIYTYMNRPLKEPAAGVDAGKQAAGKLGTLMTGAGYGETDSFSRAKDKFAEIAMDKKLDDVSKARLEKEIMVAALFSEEVDQSTREEVARKAINQGLLSQKEIAQGIGAINKDGTINIEKYNAFLATTISKSKDWSLLIQGIREESSKVLKVIDQTSELIGAMRSGLPAVMKELAEAGVAGGKPVELAMKLDVTLAKADLALAMKTLNAEAAVMLATVQATLASSDVESANALHALGARSNSQMRLNDIMADGQAKVEGLKTQLLDLNAELVSKPDDEGLKKKIKTAEEALGSRINAAREAGMAFAKSMDVPGDSMDRVGKSVEYLIARIGELNTAMGKMGKGDKLDETRKKVADLNGQLVMFQGVMAGQAAVAKKMNSESLALIEAQVAPLSMRLAQQEQSTELTKSEMSNAEKAALGFAKSYEMVVETNRGLQAQRDTLTEMGSKIEKNLSSELKGYGVAYNREALLKNSEQYADRAVSAAKEQWAKTHLEEMGLTEQERIRNNILNSAIKLKGIQTKSNSILGEQLDLTKSMREGYLDAMDEVVTNAGDFAAIIGTQKTGVSQLIASGATASFKYGGVNASAAGAGPYQNIGYNTSGQLNNIEAMLRRQQQNQLDPNSPTMYDMMVQVAQAALRAGSAIVPEAQRAGGVEAQQERLGAKGARAVAPNVTERDLTAPQAMSTLGAGIRTGSAAPSAADMSKMPITAAQARATGNVTLQIPGGGFTQLPSGVTVVRLEWGPKVGEVLSANVVRSASHGESLK